MIYKSLLCLFLSVVSLHVFQALNVEEISSLKDFPDQNRAVCTAIGPICDNCTHVVYCLRNSTGHFEKVPYETCSATTKCLYDKCTSESNPACEGNNGNDNFVCIQTGIFPDPFDGVKYHICKRDGAGAIDPTSLKRRCTNNKCFDPLTKLCRKAQVNGGCPGHLLSCDVSPTGPIIGNPHLYYVCRTNENNERYPQIFQCRNDLIYNASSIQSPCVLPTYIDPGINTAGICTKSGNFEDRFDCKKYLNCPGANYAPRSSDCSTRLYFERTTNRCTAFTCIHALPNV